MKTITMYVKLLMPDTTALTTFHTLEGMGHSALKKLERFDYYSFVLDDSGDAAAFQKAIQKVDILVNANKHKAFFSLEGLKGSKEAVKVLTQSIDNDADCFLSILKNRLHFKDIKSMEKGTLWLFTLKNGGKEQAEAMTQGLLVNKHYQKYQLL
jgi:phosphoribosylformylglycinamidine (FGAM) synthase PurS component